MSIKIVYKVKVNPVIYYTFDKFMLMVYLPIANEYEHTVFYNLAFFT